MLIPEWPINKLYRSLGALCGVLVRLCKMIRTSPEDFKAPGRLAERPPPASVHTTGAQAVGRRLPRNRFWAFLRSVPYLERPFELRNAGGPARPGSAPLGSLSHCTAAIRERTTWSCPRSGAVSAPPGRESESYLPARAHQHAISTLGFHTSYRVRRAFLGTQTSAMCRAVGWCIHDILPPITRTAGKCYDSYELWNVLQGQAAILHCLPEQQEF